MYILIQSADFILCCWYVLMFRAVHMGLGLDNFLVGSLLKKTDPLSATDCL